MEKSIDQIYQDALKEIETAGSPHDLQTISVRYLGRKGRITQYLRNISSLPVEERPAAGKRANEVKKELDASIAAAIAEFETSAQRADDHIDVSLPGRPAYRGSLHPITQINQEI